MTLKIKTFAIGATLALAAGSSVGWAQERPVATTAQGSAEGMAADGVESFFGLPYAAPPVGDLRWKAPTAPAAWDGARDASTYGAACPQGAGLDSLRIEDEDCLFVNVQRPEGTTDGAALPVLVFIHGGGWQTGSGNNENLESIVRDTGVIGVTMNYRMGNLGFLPHPALAEGDDVGNYGLLDQQAALRWVQDNIAAFGGDPAQVTIGGESAGGGSVCAQIASPGGEGLYSRAIIMSGSCNAVPRDEALEAGTKIAATLGCEGDDAAACLRALPVGELLDTRPFTRPVSQTAFLPRSGWEMLEDGSFPEVPVLIGANRDEGRSFITNWASRSVPTYDKAGYEEYVRTNFGEDADAVLAVYPWPDNATRYTGTYLVAEIMMANRAGPGGLSQCKTNTIADKLTANGPVWAYEFTPDDGPGWFEVPGYSWGAGHAVELPYLIPKRGNFANNGTALSEAHRELSKSMIAAWGGFAKSGDPNAEGLPEWARYEAGSGPVMALREGGRSATIPAVALRAQHACDFWDSLAE